jgi:uncharacterized membrane protein
MLYAELALGYIAISFLVACFGIGRKFGFWGYFFGSILLTPLIGILLVCASDKRKKQYS